MMASVMMIPMPNRPATTIATMMLGVSLRVVVCAGIGEPALGVGVAVDSVAVDATVGILVEDRVVGL